MMKSKKFFVLLHIIYFIYENRTTKYGKEKGHKEH